MDHLYLFQLHETWKTGTQLGCVTNRNGVMRNRQCFQAMMFVVIMKQWKIDTTMNTGLLTPGTGA